MRYQCPTSKSRCHEPIAAASATAPAPPAPTPAAPIGSWQTFAFHIGGGPNDISPKGKKHIIVLRTSHATNLVARRRAYTDTTIVVTIE